MNKLFLMPVVAILSSHPAKSDIDRSQFMSPSEVDRLNASMIREKGYAAQIRALQEWESRMDATRKMPPDEAIPELAAIILKVSRYHIFQVPERFAIYDKSQDLLLSIPGHAEFYGDKIKENPRHPDRNRWLESLKHLPSPETVGVLGEMLSDERGRPEPEIEELDPEYWMQSPPVCHLAINTLQKMLENPPVPAADGFSEMRDDLAVWRGWYQRVKEGRQTFRFVGDPVDYTLRGPSKRGAVEPGPRDRKRSTENPPEGESADLSPPPTKPRFIAYLIGIAFVLGGYLLYRRGKRNGA